MGSLCSLLLLRRACEDDDGVVSFLLLAGHPFPILVPLILSLSEYHQHFIGLSSESTFGFTEFLNCIYYHSNI